MNRIGIRGGTAAICGLLLALTTVLPVQGALEKQDARIAASEAESVPFSSLGEAQLTVVVDDVRGLVERGRELLQGILPGGGDAMLRRQLGRLAGDVKLKAVEEGKGLAIVIFPRGVKVAFVEVSDKKADAYASVLGRRGSRVAKADGMLVVAQRDEVVSAGLVIVPEVREKLLGSKRVRGLQAEVPVARLIGKYDTQIRSAFASVSALMQMRQQMAAGRDSQGFVPTTATVNVLELEMRVAYRLLKKLDKLQVGIDLPADGVRLDISFVPVKSGDGPTSGSVPAPSAAKVMKLVPAKGGVRFAMVADPKVLSAFLEKDLGAALDETPMDPGMRDGLRKLMRDWVAIAGTATAADMMIPGKALFSGSTVVEVRDPDGFLRLVQELPGRMKESGIDKLYADMGMSVGTSVSMNVRREKGVAVHRLSFRTEAPGAGPQAAMLKAMMGDGIEYDFAVVDNHVVYALGGESVGELIDAVKAGAHPDATPAAAEKIFGPDANLYCDYNVGKLIAMVAGVMPQAGIPAKALKSFREVADSLADAPPLAIAGFDEDGRYRLSILVPAGLIAKFVEAGKAVRKAGGLPNDTIEAAETTGTKPVEENPEKK